MNKHATALFFLFSLLLSFTASADLDLFTTGPSIVLNRDLSVPGELLCHDGRYIYYKNQEFCSGYQENCESLRVVPIKQVQKVYYDDHHVITQFYEVNINYESVNDQYSRLKQCEGRSWLSSRNILLARQATEEEMPYIYVLLSSGLNVVNTPMGEIRSIRQVNLYEHDNTMLALSFLNTIKSPICDERPLYVEYVRKLGGEVSGNGWRQANVSHLQESSAIIKAKSSFNIDSVEGLMRSEFYCVKTIEL